ncbi:MAG TPA: histidine decarboxylase, partial [Candidatus Saccharimonadales bacterium]|nr:histidine decarboxylase [Candidatus Saccharimonadales bacterium]
IGFPATLDFNFDELAPLMQLFLNNLGDPYVDPLFSLHSKEFERDVIDFFAQLLRAPKDNYWGYVTNGSTESIMYGLYTAREHLPGARVYYSAAAHYGVPKNIHLLGIEGVKVNAQPNGEMDYSHLERLLQSGAGKPAIVLATIGTTMTEAKDNVATITKLLEAHTPQHYIHADAALAGTYTALLQPRFPFDFADGASSVSISGHKFIGSPMPSGIVIVRKDMQAAGGAMNYTGSTDTTISGSRNGHTPIMLWYAIQRWGEAGLRERAEDGLELAAYTHRRLKELGWPTWRNPQALTVMLATPSDALIHKWQLATAGGWSHIICMPSVTKERVDAFLDDLVSDQGFYASKSAAHDLARSIIER